MKSTTSKVLTVTAIAFVVGLVVLVNVWSYVRYKRHELTFSPDTGCFTVYNYNQPKSSVTHAEIHNTPDTRQMIFLNVDTLHSEIKKAQWDEVMERRINR